MVDTDRYWRFAPLARKTKAQLLEIVGMMPNGEELRAFAADAPLTKAVITKFIERERAAYLDRGAAVSSRSTRPNKFTGITGHEADAWLRSLPVRAPHA